MSFEIDLVKTFPTDWLVNLHANEYMHLLKEIEYNLISLIKPDTIIYPKTENIFRAFELTSFENIKVVIIGQDPYHGEGEANGLCFSVNEGVKIPPSLRNIYKELQHDLGKTILTHGDLSNWAKQGVLLLNASLTVEANKANSHEKIGWHEFTDFIIKSLSNQKTGLVFLLWGKFAEKKKSLIDEKKHHILISSHPSPLGVYKGFAGCSHFSKTNEILILQQESPIEW